MGALCMYIIWAAGYEEDGEEEEEEEEEEEG